MTNLKLPDLSLEVLCLLVELCPRPHGDLLTLRKLGLRLLAFLDQGQILSLQFGEQVQQLLRILRYIFSR